MVGLNLTLTKKGREKAGALIYFPAILNIYESGLEA
jgi:hypothetical protein